MSNVAFWLVARKRPADFLCDRCTTPHQVAQINVHASAEVSLVAALEAAAETEHFAATGCRGRVRLAELVAITARDAALLERAVRAIEALPVVGVATVPYLAALKAAAEAVRALADQPEGERL
jgi:hypothetical protein